MKITDQFGNIYNCVKCNRPKMSGKGATWDSFEHYINDNLVNFYLDTSWGRFYYFIHNESWYKFNTMPEYYELLKSQNKGLVYGKGNCEPVDSYHFLQYKTI